VFDQLLFYDLGRDWKKFHPLASRNDRGQQPGIIDCKQDDENLGGRLLQCFEQAIGRFFVQVFGTIDDKDTVPALIGLQSGSLLQLSYLANGDLFLGDGFAGASIGQAPDYLNIGMLPCCDAETRRTESTGLHPLLTV